MARLITIVGAIVLAATMALAQNHIDQSTRSNSDGAYGYRESSPNPTATPQFGNQNPTYAIDHYTYNAYSYPQPTTTDIWTILVAIATGILAITSIGLWWTSIRQWQAISHQATSADESLVEARRAATAATQSTEIAQRALIAGQRAFVSIASYHPVAAKKLESGRVEAWGFFIKWQNTGNTPTRNMEIHLSAKAFDSQIPHDWDFPDLWGKTAETLWVPIPIGIGPKGIANSQTIYISTDTVEDVIKGKKFMYLWGWAIYDDVFPDTPRHVTRFAVSLAIGGNPQEPDKISFSFNNLPNYNCSDEECARQDRPADWKPRNAAE